MPRWTFILALICSGIFEPRYSRAEVSEHAARPAAAKPNVVFILADDFGYGDLGCYGHPYARTPAIDGLSKDGTRFTQFYATGVTCCPSRTGFMTSKFPATFHDYPADSGFGSRVTISELLKKNGYRTGHFGKWHMGPVDSAGTYGFDATPSSPGSEAGKIRPKQDPRGRDASLFDQAISFIEKNKDQPFYVNVWAHSTHMPVDPPVALTEEWKDLVVNEDDFPGSMREKFKNCRDRGGDVNQAMRCYLAEVGGLDRNVGRLLQTLDDLGLRENTIVVFSSDQGPAPLRTAEEEDTQAKEPKAKKAGKTAGAGKTDRSIVQLNMMGSAGELRGGKHTESEGGVRVPFIVRWPGHVSAARVDTQSVISGVDWLPTLCRFAGVDIDASDFDGEDISAAWLGTEQKRTKPLFWKTSATGSTAVIRDGRWKLFHPTRKRGEVELYDIAADPAEENNVASQQPDLVKELAAKLDAWTDTLPTEYAKTKDRDD